MSTKTVFKGAAIKSELIVMMLEKWDLHPQMEELTAEPNPDDLDRDSQVLVPEVEYERAHEILFGESEFDRAGF